MDTKLHPGQAMIELAMGIFALTLVVSALCTFALYIVRSLEMQNSVRVKSSSQRDVIEVSSFAAENLFGTDQLEVRESVSIPSLHY